MIPRSLGRLVAFAALVATISSGCSSTMQDAATIRFEDDAGDHVVHVRMDDFEDELRDISEDPAFLALLQVPEDAETPTDYSVDASIAPAWLNLLVLFTAVDAEFDVREGQITDADRDAAEQLIAETKVKGPVRDRLLRSLARRNALVTAATASTTPTEAELRQYFEDNEEALTACASGKELFVIAFASQQEADAAKSDIDGGAAFEDVARERSVDDATGESGGSYGCLDALGTLPPEIDAVVSPAAVDDVVGPVALQNTFYVIKVGAWETPTFEDLRDRITQQLAADAQQQPSEFDQALQDRLRAMRVHVDPRFGTWVVSDEGGAFVEPPGVPEVRDQRERRLDPEDVLTPGGLSG